MENASNYIDLITERADIFFNLLTFTNLFELIVCAISASISIFSLGIVLISIKESKFKINTEIRRLLKKQVFYFIVLNLTELTHTLNIVSNVYFSNRSYLTRLDRYLMQSDSLLSGTTECTQSGCCSKEF